MQQTENQRLKIIINKLNLTQGQFAAHLAMQPGSISDVLRGKVKVSTKIKRRLELDFNVDIGWLETGEGLPFKNSNELHEPKSAYNKNLSVPVYDVEFSAGVMASLVDSRENHYPVGYLNIPQVSGCDAVIKAKGDSMADRINDGDWIGIKRLDNWREWLPMGYIYAFATDEVELVKYIKKGDNPDTFKIVSHNEFYEEDEIPKKLIREIWAVKAVLPFSNIKTFI